MNKTREMADELRTLGAPDYRQYESIMRVRWGRDFDLQAFLAAAEIANREEEDALLKESLREMGIDPLAGDDVGHK